MKINTLLHCGLLLALLIIGIGMSRNKQPTLEMNFVCDWWSEKQMEGLDLDSPPPKSTKTIIKKWEYSDPIGVPHPDKIDISAVIYNKQKTQLPKTTAFLTLAWNVGPIKNANKAKYQIDKNVRSTDVSLIVSGGSGKIVFKNIDLKKRQKSLFKKGLWPHHLKATIRLAPTSHPSQTITENTAILPMIPGD